MAWEPAPRRGGSWPGDRPVRWGGVARGLLWLIAAGVALIAQLALVVPLLAVTSGTSGEALGPLGRVVLGLVWGGLTIWAAWSWVLGRWRVVVAPLVTAVALWVAAGLG